MTASIRLAPPRALALTIRRKPNPSVETYISLRTTPMTLKLAGRSFVVSPTGLNHNKNWVVADDSLYASWLAGSLVDLGLPVSMEDVDIALRLAFAEVFGTAEPVVPRAAG